MNGKEVYSTEIKPQSQNDIRLPFLVDGVYACLISNATERHFKKLIVIHD